MYFTFCSWMFFIWTLPVVLQVRAWRWLYSGWQSCFWLLAVSSFKVFLICVHTCTVCLTVWIWPAVGITHGASGTAYTLVLCGGSWSSLPSAPVQEVASLPAVSACVACRATTACCEETARRELTDLKWVYQHVGQKRLQQTAVQKWLGVDLKIVEVGNCCWHGGWEERTHERQKSQTLKKVMECKKARVGVVKKLQLSKVRRNSRYNKQPCACSSGVGQSSTWGVSTLCGEWVTRQMERMCPIQVGHAQALQQG